jgi:uncharacterized membrane-anchored protein
MATEQDNKTESVEDFSKKNKEIIIGIGLIFGVGLGAAFGAATDNVSMGVAIGSGVGLMIDAVIYARLSAQETE